MSEAEEKIDANDVAYWVTPSPNGGGRYLPTDLAAGWFIEGEKIVLLMTTNEVNEATAIADGLLAEGFIGDEESESTVVERQTLFTEIAANVVELADAGDLVNVPADSAWQPGDLVKDTDK